MADVTQTDVSRPSALPSARLKPTAHQLTVDQSSDEYLINVEEEWNKKIDVEVETLVDGMVDIVTLASIGDKDKFRIAQEAFQTECRAESMQISLQRDATLKESRAGAKEAKDKVAQLLTELLGTVKETTNGDDLNNRQTL